MTFSSDHPLILDLSRHEGLVDMAKLANHPAPVMGVIARSTISWGYRDSLFPHFKKGTREQSKIRIDKGGDPLFFGAYHVIYPGQPIQPQVDNFMTASGDDVAEDYPATIDAELDHGMSVLKIADSIGQMITALFQRTGKVPIVYSRAGWLNKYVTADGNIVPVWFNSVKFHLALYGPVGVEHPGPLSGNTTWGIPKGLASTENLLLHQTSDTISGTPYGTPNAEKVDTNRWQFSKDHLLEFIGYVKPVPLTLETLNERVKILEREAKLHGWNLKP